MSRLGPAPHICKHTTNWFQCSPFDARKFLSSELRYESFTRRVSHLQSYLTMPKFSDSKWEKVAYFDQKLARWANEFPDVAGRIRVIHYLNALAIDAGNSKHVDAFIRCLLPIMTNRENRESILGFCDQSVGPDESALVRAMRMGDTLLLRDLIALCRDVTLSKEHGKMLRRFLRVYRIETRESGEILEFYDKWAKYPESYSTENESMIDWAERYKYLNCDLGDGVTPLGSALHLKEHGVADWLRKLGATTVPISQSAIMAAVKAVDPKAAAMIESRSYLS